MIFKITRIFRHSYLDIQNNLTIVCLVIWNKYYFEQCAQRARKKIHGYFDIQNNYQNTWEVIFNKYYFEQRAHGYFDIQNNHQNT